MLQSEARVTARRNPLWEDDAVLCLVGCLILCQAPQHEIVVVPLHNTQLSLRADSCPGGHHLCRVCEPALCTLAAALLVTAVRGATTHTLGSGPVTSLMRLPMLCSVLKSKGVPSTGSASPVGMCSSSTGV